MGSWDRADQGFLFGHVQFVKSDIEKTVVVHVGVEVGSGVCPEDKDPFFPFLKP